jgi:quercetin dioxygenase-like cupin family protein
MKNTITYGTLSKAARKKTSWGTKATLFERWDALRLNGYLFEFTKSSSYAAWADPLSENLCVVEAGKGSLEYAGKKYTVTKGYAFKIFPGQEVMVKPQGKLIILSVQKPSSLAKAKQTKEDLSVLHIVDVKKTETKVYEYEALAQEIFTPKYKGGLGLITFTFPIREIPFHIHPFSGRLIRTISGTGWTYCEPNVYEMNEDTFSLFPKGVVHTNGPVPGDVFKVYAFQLPYITSKVDEKNIAGSPRFVRYVGQTPPRKLWKKKEDFTRVISRLSRK